MKSSARNQLAGTVTAVGQECDGYWVGVRVSEHLELQAIVLLSDGASDEETIATFRTFNGAEQLQAMVKEQVVVIPFVLTDPPNVLSVAGASTLAEKLAK